MYGNLTLKEWEKRGAYLESARLNNRIFVLDLGNKSAAASKTLLMIHGFPESSFSYHKVIDHLLGIFERIVLFDFLGFGFSDKPKDFTYSIINAADTALMVWREIGVNGGHVLSHDMGDSVNAELLYRQTNRLLPAWLSSGILSSTFTNGGMLIELINFRIGQRMLLGPLGRIFSWMSNPFFFKRQIQSANGSGRLKNEDFKHLWEAVCINDGKNMMHKLIYYFKDREKYQNGRWYAHAGDNRIPIHICWGEKDRVNPVIIAHTLKERIFKNALVSLMPDAGHFCALDSPEEFAKKIMAFYQ